MLKTIGNTYQMVLERWTGAVTAWPRAVIGAAVLLTFFSLQFLVNNIAIDTSTGDMLSEELDFRKFNKEMDEAFPQSSDSILVVIDGQTEDLADSAALKLATAMRSRPRLFHDVYDLAGDPFFRKNGLLYLDLDDLYDLSDQLAEAQPFLASLWQDPSLNGFFTLLSKGLDTGADDAASAPFELDRMLDRLSLIAEAQIANQFAQLSWRKLMQNSDDKPDEINRRFLLVAPTLDFASLQPASDAMDGIREISQALNMTPENGLRIRLSGSAALEQEELESVEEGMGLAGILSFVLVMGLLIIGLRRPWRVISCLITLIFGLVWTGAFAIFALGSLNLISVAFAVLFIGLSVDFGIHYALRFEEAGHIQGDQRTALIQTASSVGGALTLSAIGAAIAFYSFIPTDYNGLAELGLIAGTGMFIAFFANMTLLPALLVIRPASSASSLASSTFSAKQGKAQRTDLFLRFRRSIVGLFLVSAGLALVWVPDVKFDFDPLNLKNRQTESMSTLIDLMSDSRTSPYSINVLVPDLTTAQDLAVKLGDLGTVKSAETIVDYIPKQQQEKLDVISTTALFLGPSFNSEFAGQKSAVTSQQALKSFIGVLAPLSKNKSASRLHQALVEIDQRPSGAGELEERLLAHLPAQLNSLKTSLEASQVDLNDLPQSLRDRKIAADGRTIIEVFPSNDVTQQALLIEFVDEVRTVAPRAIGSPVVILEAGKAILGAFYQAGATSVILIAVMLLIVLGNMRDVFLVFAPLFLAGLFTLAASVGFGLAFNFANVIVLPLLFGLGVAGGIHLVARAETGSNKITAENSTTPRAILFSALTTVGSFGSIALSSHPGTASMGTLLAIAITLTLLCTLVFLPALMAMLKNQRNADTKARS